MSKPKLGIGTTIRVTPKDAKDHNGIDDWGLERSVDAKFDGVGFLGCAIGDGHGTRHRFSRSRLRAIAGKCRGRMPAYRDNIVCMFEQLAVEFDLS